MHANRRSQKSTIVDEGVSFLSPPYKKEPLKVFETFNDLSLPLPLAAALTKMNFINPTPVQHQTIPAAMAGNDILATAQTGTGKTGAFGIPIMTTLVADPKQQALILAPTRELAAQIHTVLKQMSTGLKFRGTLVVGGESFNRQADDLYRGCDYIVATPGRLNDHLQQGTVNLGAVGMLILDEVDRMLDMGFAPQIKQIMRFLPEQRQTLLFSATLPAEITQLANALLKNPIRIAVTSVTQEALKVTEVTINCSNEAKNKIILEELDKRQGKIIIFARTQSRTERLAKQLYSEGHDVVCLHGGRSQSQRKQALERFRSGTHRIMVATDLAGRGIDVLDIEHVINYDVPGSREDYIHRIGRTGRCGKTGNALTLLAPADVDGERILSGQKAPARMVYRTKRWRR